MREQIETLMKRAGTDTSGKWMGVEHAEKFAELILKECGIALNPMLRDMISRGQGVELINKHFGVKE